VKFFLKNFDIILEGIKGLSMSVFTSRISRMLTTPRPHRAEVARRFSEVKGFIATGKHENESEKLLGFLDSQRGFCDQALRNLISKKAPYKKAIFYGLPLASSAFFALTFSNPLGMIPLTVSAVYYLGRGFAYKTRYLSVMQQTKSLIRGIETEPNIDDKILQAKALFGFINGLSIFSPFKGGDFSNDIVKALGTDWKRLEYMSKQKISEAEEAPQRVIIIPEKINADQIIQKLTDSDYRVRKEGYNYLLGLSSLKSTLLIYQGELTELINNLSINLPIPTDNSWLNPEKINDFLKQLQYVFRNDPLLNDSDRKTIDETIQRTRTNIKTICSLSNTENINDNTIKNILSGLREIYSDLSFLAQCINTKEPDVEIDSEKFEPIKKILENRKKAPFNHKELEMASLLIIVLDELKAK
jgi:hypothetical protein